MGQNNEAGNGKERLLAPLFTWRSAICESGLPPTTRHVALTLTIYMNEKGGSCFPSIATLADDTGLDRKTVITHLGRLHHEGWLEVVRGGGRSRSNHYTATIPKGWSSSTVSAEDAPSKPPESGNGGGDPPFREKGGPAPPIRDLNGGSERERVDLDAEKGGPAPPHLSSNSSESSDAPARAREESARAWLSPEPPEADEVFHVPELHPRRGDDLKGLWENAWRTLEVGPGDLHRYILDNELRLDFGMELVAEGGASYTTHYVVAWMIHPPDTPDGMKKWATRVDWIWRELFHANKQTRKQWFQSFATKYPNPSKTAIWRQLAHAA